MQFEAHLQGEEFCPLQWRNPIKHPTSLSYSCLLLLYELWHFCLQECYSGLRARVKAIKPGLMSCGALFCWPPQIHRRSEGPESAKLVSGPVSNIQRLNIVYLKHLYLHHEWYVLMLNDAYTVTDTSMHGWNHNLTWIHLTLHCREDIVLQISSVEWGWILCSFASCCFSVCVPANSAHAGSIDLSAVKSSWKSRHKDNVKYWFL